MNKEKHIEEKAIEEMAKVIEKTEQIARDAHCGLPSPRMYAKDLYWHGYCKQSEGHWFILEYEYFTCSECGYYHPNGCDSTKEAKDKLADGKVPKYCSECGAKMKGGAE